MVSPLGPPDDEGPQEAAAGQHQNATTSATTTFESLLD